jgi:rhamnogalacturonan endolyase
VIEGREQPASGSFTLPAGAPPRAYLSLPLQTPEGYSLNDASAGDLDGDGAYEIVLHQVGRGRDNSQAGVTTEPILQGYKLDGTLLWSIRLGRNIREGAHYTQFLVYDFDGDGRAEVACKTADGTVDGQGKILGDAAADHRNELGYVLAGPERLTVFDGRTGAALATADYVPPRGTVADWGDDYGNRVDRFLACVVHLDGKRPSLVFCRGYYTRTVLVAWDWRDGKLTRRWTFDSDDGTPGNRAYRGQGNHQLNVGDVDGAGARSSSGGQPTTASCGSSRPRRRRGTAGRRRCTIRSTASASPGKTSPTTSRRTRASGWAQRHAEHRQGRARDYEQLS